MRQKIFVAEQGDRLSSFIKACQDVYGEHIPSHMSERFSKTVEGEILFIGENQQGQKVYWVDVSHSFSTCRQAWADFLPLFGGCISQWKIVRTKDRCSGGC